MGIIPNTVGFGSGLNIGSAGPIDSRTRVEFKSDLTNAFGGVKYPAYDGMAVYVMESGEKYILHGTDSSDIKNWTLQIDQPALISWASDTSSFFSGSVLQSRKLVDKQCNVLVNTDNELIIEFENE